MFKKTLTTGLGAFLAFNALAGADGVFDPNLPFDWASVITVSGGPVWSNPGKDQYLYPYPPPLNNHFIPDRATSILGSGEIYFGLQRLIGPAMIGQFGIGVAGASDATLTGVVDVNGVPAVNTYNYKVSHVRGEFKGKLICASYTLVQPYLSGSFGVGFNHSHGYIPTTIDPILYPASWFDTNSTVAFSYTLGLGAQRALTPNWLVGVGYEFADWGKNYLGGDDNLLNEGPGSAHLYTHELLFSLSFVF